MRILSVFMLLLLTTQIAVCQEEKKIPVILKLNIPSLVDETTFPTVRLSAERKLGEKISLAIETGYQLYTIENFADTAHAKSRGVKLGAELRYYPRHKNISDMTGFYLAVNPFLRYNTYTERVHYYPADVEKVYTWDEMLADEFAVKKTVTGIHLIVGKQVNFKYPSHKERRYKIVSRVFLDGSLGLGGFYRHIKNEQREYDEDLFKRDRPRHPNVYYAKESSSLSENSRANASFVFNLRVGYRL